MLRKIPTSNMSKEEWTKLRSTTIGGSDAASIIGLNPHKSAYALWAEKTGKVIPEDISQKEAVRLGTDLEDYVAHRFMESTGKKVRRENYTVFRDDMPYAHANYDRLVIGERAGLEIKTTNALNLKKFKNGEFPANYYCQCCHYLLISGLDRWYLAVLVLGVDFKVFTIERDEAELAALKMAEENFWYQVQNDLAPEIDGMDSTIDALNETFPISDPKADAVDLTSCAVDLALLDECTQQIKALEEKKKAAQARVMETLGAAEKGFYGGYSVSWKSQKRSTFDRKKWEKEHGEIPEEYFKVSDSRTFRFKKEEF
nr:MAG TPA: Exonuclease [Caudoviricetes sp.]